MTAILNASTLEEVLDMPTAIEAVESVFREMALGQAVQPTPLAMGVAPVDSSFIVMPGVSSGAGLASVKLLADVPSNAGRAMPTQRSLILLSDHLTGEPLAILDGRVPTRIRTAAASAVASRHLARPDSATLGMVGAGALAIAHVHAMTCVLPIKRVVVWSRTRERVDAFKRALEHLGLQIDAVQGIEDVMAESDVVCTVTPAREPNVLGEWFQPGQHINAVGARPRPTEREIDSAGMARARVIVDHRGTAEAKSGEYLIAIAEGAITPEGIAGELGQVIAGQVPGRTGPEEITLFNSVGVGLQDLAIGRLAYDRALARGLGERVNLAL